MGNGWFRGEEWEKGRKSGKATFLTQNRVDTIARAGAGWEKDFETSRNGISKGCAPP